MPAKEEKEKKKSVPSTEANPSKPQTEVLLHVVN